MFCLSGPFYQRRWQLRYCGSSQAELSSSEFFFQSAHGPKCPKLRILRYRQGKYSNLRLHSFFIIMLDVVRSV